MDQKKLRTPYSQPAPLKFLSPFSSPKAIDRVPTHPHTQAAIIQSGKRHLMQMSAVPTKSATLTKTELLLLPDGHWRCCLFRLRLEAVSTATRALPWTPMHLGKRGQWASEASGRARPSMLEAGHGDHRAGMRGTVIMERACVARYILATRYASGLPTCLRLATQLANTCWECVAIRHYRYYPSLSLLSDKAYYPLLSVGSAFLSVAIRYSPLPGREESSPTALREPVSFPPEDCGRCWPSTCHIRKRGRLAPAILRTSAEHLLARRHHSACKSWRCMRFRLHLLARRHHSVALGMERVHAPLAFCTVPLWMRWAERNAGSARGSARAAAAHKCVHKQP